MGAASPPDPGLVRCCSVSCVCPVCVLCVSCVCPVCVLCVSCACACVCFCFGVPIQPPQRQPRLGPEAGGGAVGLGGMPAKGRRRPRTHMAAHASTYPPLPLQSQTFKLCVDCERTPCSPLPAPPPFGRCLWEITRAPTARLDIAMSEAHEAAFQVWVASWPCPAPCLSLCPPPNPAHTPNRCTSTETNRSFTSPWAVALVSWARSVFCFR